jgi:hypothetical protein
MPCGFVGMELPEGLVSALVFLAPFLQPWIFWMEPCAMSKTCCLWGLVITGILWGCGQQPYPRLKGQPDGWARGQAAICANLYHSGMMWLETFGPPQKHLPLFWAQLLWLPRWKGFYAYHTLPCPRSFLKFLAPFPWRGP